MAYPCAWFGTQCEIEITPKGETGQKFEAEITDFDMGEFTRDVDEVVSFNDNHCMYDKPAELSEGSLTCIATDTKFAQMVLGAGATGYDWTDVQTAGGVSGDAQSSSATMGTRLKVRIAVYLPEEDPSSGAFRRITIYDAIGVTYNETAAPDGYYEISFGFKYLPQNISIDSTADNSGTPITTLPAYT